MPKVLCTLPNASAEISGVKFVTHAAGMLSEEISDGQAADFASIPGYEIVGAAPAAAPVPPEPTAAEAAAAREAAEAAEASERTALLARAEAVGFTVKNNWGLPRLRAEVADAEKEAADKAQKDAAAKGAEGGDGKSE